MNIFTWRLSSWREGRGCRRRRSLCPDCGSWSLLRAGARRGRWAPPRVRCPPPRGQTPCCCPCPCTPSCSGRCGQILLATLQIFLLLIPPALIAAPLPGLLALGHHNLLAELGLQLTQLAQDGVKLVVLTNIFCNYSNIFGTIKYFHLTVLEVDEGAAIL